MFHKINMNLIEPAEEYCTEWHSC